MMTNIVREDAEHNEKIINILTRSAGKIKSVELLEALDSTTCLDLSNGKYIPDINALVTILPHLRLTKLYAPAVGMRNVTLRSLIHALPISTITKLYLGHNLKTEGSAMLAQALPSMSALTVLNLRGNNIRDYVAGIIARALPHMHLIKLDLSYNPKICTNRGTNNRLCTGIRAMINALAHSSLKKLILSWCGITEDVAIAIGNVLQRSSLTRLVLRGNQSMGNGTLNIVCALPQSRLTFVNFEDVQINDATIVTLANALSCPQSRLTKLNLKYSNIRTDGAKIIAAALSGSSLTNLNLRRNHIETEGAIAIAGALEHSSLTKLGLAWNGIRTEGIIAICTALPNSLLVTLDLSYNDIEKEGCKAIIDILSDSFLTKLVLNVDESTRSIIDIKLLENAERHAERRFRRSKVADTNDGDSMDI